MEKQKRIASYYFLAVVVGLYKRSGEKTGRPMCLKCWIINHNVRLDDRLDGSVHQASYKCKIEQSSTHKLLYGWQKGPATFVPCHLSHQQSRSPSKHGAALYCPQYLNLCTFCTLMPNVHKRGSVKFTNHCLAPGHSVFSSRPYLFFQASGSARVRLGATDILASIKVRPQRSCGWGPGAWSRCSQSRVNLQMRLPLNVSAQQQESG